MRTLLPSDTDEGAEIALSGLPAAMKRHREEADDYPTITRLNTGWHMIECRDSIRGFPAPSWNEVWTAAKGGSERSFPTF